MFLTFRNRVVRTPEDAGSASAWSSASKDCRGFVTNAAIEVGCALTNGSRRQPR